MRAAAPRPGRVTETAPGEKPPGRFPLEEKMTEHGTWTEEHFLTSDPWSGEKSMAPMTDEEELKAWRTTTKMIDKLCGMADALMLEPLILALADALGRAREEERRAEDRLTRPEGVELGPREEERLRAMMRRSDAFNNAVGAVLAEEDVREEIRAECLAVLEEACREAHEAFVRYRAEVGLPDNPLKKGARKPV